MAPILTDKTTFLSPSLWAIPFGDQIWQLKSIAMWLCVHSLILVFALMFLLETYSLSPVLTQSNPPSLAPSEVRSSPSTKPPTWYLSRFATLEAHGVFFLESGCSLCKIMEISGIASWTIVESDETCSCKIYKLIILFSWEELKIIQ